MVKNLPAVQETWVRSLGGEDPLEKGMSTHFSILAWRIPWTEEPGVGHDGVTTTFTFFFLHQGSPLNSFLTSFLLCLLLYILFSTVESVLNF